MPRKRQSFSGFPGMDQDAFSGGLHHKDRVFLLLPWQIPLPMMLQDAKTTPTSGLEDTSAARGRLSLKSTDTISKRVGSLWRIWDT